ncbi:DNA polymerase III subunit alpha [bacterium]|nr:DNA polymerase III subunit alpha [bacterium]
MHDIVHLQTHSVYSFRQSTLAIPDLVSEAVARGHKAIALTDMDGLYGFVPFVQAARKAGIRPIIGAELSLKLGDAMAKVPQRATLLVRDETGFKNLSRLVSRFQLGGRKGLSPEELADHAAGLILLTGGERGALPRLVSEGRIQAAEALLRDWREAFGAAHCFVQLGPWWPSQPLLRLAEACEVKVVAAHEAAYLRPEDLRTWHLLRAGHGLAPVASGPRHLASDAELRQAWQALPEALANTWAIAERCTYTPVFGAYRLPEFPGRAADETSEAMLRRRCAAGLEHRYAASSRGAEARRRMEEELAVIVAMGFADYFLVAWDLVRFAQTAGIPHIPRGSAAGSLVLYLLGVTQICPLEHHLCFERFLNPERKSLPDIDMDFDWRRRDEVVDYCFKTYGEAHVARIATHQHHGARGAVRLAGAALGLEPALVDDVAQRMPRWAGAGDIASAVAKAPECQGLPIEQAPYKELFETAQAFEGIPDHLGLHACGVVISSGPLSDVVPLEASAKGPIVTQFEMEGVEAVGLLKMDLLGNRNLAILDEAVALVNRRHGLSLAVDELPLDDPEAFRLLGEGRAFGIYQMESSGVQGLLRQFRPTDLEDVTAITSLYRPGPLQGGITTHYVERRHGREAVVYPDPCLAELLTHTYGCILYQEQCLQVSHLFAGLSLGQCENLRRGLAKRKRSEITGLEQAFFEGARRLGREEAHVQEVWKLLSNFGGYGFVKAHAASCAALAIREAYIKARWPIEYLSVVLSAGCGYYPPRIYLEDARSFGARVVLPCVNRSDEAYTVEEGGVLRVGLGAIKGLGPVGMATILRARQDGPFLHLGDLRRRTGLSRSELETLITIGACDAFGVSRPGLLWQLTMLGTTKTAPRIPAQAMLFPLVEAMPEPPSTLADYSDQRRQAIERERLGYAVTVTRLPKMPGCHSFEEARALPVRSKVQVVAECVSRSSRRTRNGDKMCFLTLSDGENQLRAILFPEAYRKFVLELRKGAAVFSGVLGNDEGEPILTVTCVTPLVGGEVA